MRPICYLDIDGVINMCVVERPEDVPEEHSRTDSIASGIRWDQRVIDFFNDIHRRGLVEIVWLTTWETRAVTELTPKVGLDQFRVSTARYAQMPFEGAYGWWKFDAVLHNAQSDCLDKRTVIWIDDDIPYSMSLNPSIGVWVADRQADGLITTLVAPDSLRALTPDHLVQIAAALRG